MKGRVYVGHYGVATGTVCCNRNGRYCVFEARGNDVLCVKVEIRPIGQ